ncbi:uncharacterized protein KIAA1671 homolog isoform X1 [Crotalus tigris]|uniref:uncharacterized protein KIAA1671 homolog isoform X1 n=2 Tax=Crotalus tigris TaxID=88082 RepID=UPI00192F32B2|nr:uncharacterized protein KIAA1671 homolog isoform X1 [Crotalus tigris]XP_039218723.1 uncharacterized protein KIAA1671 homolog isoform X1 [Crotalus tigris]XP_039218724.1 uncharacterized protein KIAA1671 homolog isoform X1 [Crotalus tigris]XP_039218725.1 uncharacterized protein KIAA1671 homolog isoform X1 [Crotalus tigris]XP_039218726.1 uncharacterized protein KIAA1671 homolog isoform X1 [Crotalus tigris]XP_039218727.1 uncharacterized protein KIAA1671 homolog isoform X1 [Crotalus tigris]XP_03
MILPRVSSLPKWNPSETGCSFWQDPRRPNSVRRLRSAMATQVEFGSALTSLAGISEPRKEAIFRHSFTSPLSDTGPSSLAPLILEGRNKVGNAVGPTTMPSAASRPPWAPRPFSREASTDTFATVKPPIPALKPSSTAPKSPTVAQIFEDAPRGSTGNVPPLLDQNSMESQPPREPVAHLPVCLSPQANTVILFESRSPAKGGPKEGGPKAQEGQLLRSQSEKWPRRRPSLSTDPKPLSWAPHWREAIAGAPRGSASSVEPQQRPTLAAETHSQAGGRPAASAGFRESWQEQTQSTPPAAASGPGTPKPRPLPTDLTGRFASQELPWQKKPCLAESREKSDRALEATGARSAAAGLRGAAPGVQSASQLAESPQSCLPSAAAGAAPPGQAVPEDLGQNSRKEETVPWELGIQGKPSVGQHNASTGQPLGEWGEVSPQEAGLRNTDALDGKHGGCGKKTVPLLDPSAKPWAPSPSESLCGSPGQELRILNVQQRIQVLTAENAGFKAGSLRASFRSRPLSTDLTKMFSGPVTASELKPKRQPEWNRKPAGEIRDAPEDLPTGGKDVGEVSMAGSPWKPPLLAKTPSTEGPPKREGTLAKGRPNASSPGKDPGLVLSSKARTFSSSSTEDAGPKTVRATMFEHHVQRHSVVTSQLGPEPALLSLMPPFGDSPSRGRESGSERMLGDGQSGKASARGADASGGARGSKDPRPLTEDEDSPLWAEEPSREKDEQSASKGVEDSLLAQRIEPRYEVLHTVGERAQSEAVAAISGGKAITLRRQRPLKENRRAGGYGRSKDWSEAPAPGTGLLKDLAAFKNQGAFSREGTGADRNRAGQQPASEKAASFRMKEDRNFAPWLDTEKERWLAPAGLRDRIPRRAGARVPGADDCEGQKTSPLQSGSCPGLLFGLDLKPPQGSEGQKLHLAGYGVQEQWEGTTEGKELRGAGIKVKWVSSFRNVSAPKGSDRWRRKTLPHSAARLEGPGEPPQDPAELASRSDALHLMDGAAAKRSPQALRGLGPRQAEVTCPSSPRKPLPPSEPKATYFAVTCQISEEEINNQPGRAAAVAPPVSASRRADPSDCQHRECFSEGGSSAGRPLSRPRGERAASDRSVTGASREPLTEARDQGQELLQRQLEAASEGRLARADPPFCPGTRSPPYLAPLQQDSQRKRSGALDFGRAEEKAPDHYRSRVVDIDELMAEYGGESQKLCEWEGQRESTFLPWEKWPPRHNSSGNLPCSSDQREKSRVGHSLGSRAPGTGASSGEGSHVHEGDALEIHPQESRAREEKRSPPQWGKPDTEKAKPWSAEPPGPRTKTAFLVGREEGEGTGQGPQSARDATPGPHPACMDLRALWKEASPKKWAVLAPAGGWCPSSDWGGKTGWKAEPQAGVWEKDSPAAHAGTERSNSTASLGTGTTPDLKCSSSEKNHQSQARPSFPSEPRLDQPHVCQRFTPERPGVWLSEGGPSPRDCFSHGGTRDLGKEGLTVDHDDATTTKRSLYLLTQRQSFHKERRTDHWSGGHFKECFGRPSAEARDTDVLVQEADSRYGTWGDRRHMGDSFTPESPSWEGSVAPAQKLSPVHRTSLYSSQRDLATAAGQQDSSGEQRSPSLADSSPDADSASSPAEKASPDFSFLEQTPRLDSGTLKSRVLLGKRRQQPRAPISRILRRSASGATQPPPFSAAEGAASAWMFRDSTEEKPPRRTKEEEEEPPPAERQLHAQPRLPLFPGLAPSALKTQLRKRHDLEGGREEAPPAPLCKSPKGPFLAPAATPEKEGRPEDLPPPWLTELKSRRKQGQPESPL